MWEKNRKVHFTQKAVPDSKKPYKPTAFELAFQEAEASKKKDAPAMKQHNLPKATPPPVPGNKPSVKLGLKTKPKETLVLDSGVSQEKQKHSPIKNQKIEIMTGRSQVHDGNHNNESDIVIGFDFGTSSSKIVIRDSGRQTAYAVPFGSLACSGNSYLIPTNIFISNDGKLSLSKGKYTYSNLKIHLMDKHEKIVLVPNTSLRITVSELAAAYMALVIRFSRDWFLKHKESIYKKTDIHWHINLGIPSKNYDDQERRKIFRTIAMAAWRISRLNTTITVAKVKKGLALAPNHISTEGQDIDPDLWLHPDFVNTHPEVIMEVVGYAHSPLRTSGLHLLIDVGAATLDTATFIIHDQEGEDVYPLLETNVKRYGTMGLHKRRVQVLKNSLQKILRQKNSIDPTKPLPDLAHYDIQAGKNDLTENDAIFFRECHAQIGKVIRDTKDRRDPNSVAWDRGLPVFICGGGGRHPSYRKMIKHLSSGLDAHTDIKSFNFKEIPKPDQLDAPDLSRQDYDRLAVAFGLSFTSFEIGEVIPKSKVSDIIKKENTLSVDDQFVDKDMC